MLSTKNQSQFKELLDIAIRAGASDIHLSVGALPIMRINGTLQVISEDVVITTEFVEELADHLAGLDEREVKRGSELYFAVNLNPGFRVKVTIFYQKGLPAVTLRFIPQKIKTIEQLHLPATIEGFTNQQHGLIIITGTYGAGKTSTIAALVQGINATRKRYVVTLEKPMEYLYTSQLSIIEQREVGKDTESFEKGLAHLRHEDVDIIVLSQFSSEAAIISALELARGNALVMVAIEAGSVIGALEKIIQKVSADQRKYVQRVLGEALVGVAALRLVPRLGGGMIPATEILVATDPVRSALEKGDFNNINTIITTGAKDGMLSFDRTLVEYVQRHLISPEEAMKHATNPKSIKRTLGTSVAGK